MKHTHTHTNYSSKLNYSIFKRIASRWASSLLNLLYLTSIPTKTTQKADENADFGNQWRRIGLKPMLRFSFDEFKITRLYVISSKKPKKCKISPIRLKVRLQVGPFTACFFLIAKIHPIHKTAEKV